MCQCTPEIKSPFCGKPGCKWPMAVERTELGLKPAMTIDEALEFADLWRSGTSIREDSGGWSDVCMLLAEEVRRLRDERDRTIVGDVKPAIWIRSGLVEWVKGAPETRSVSTPLHGRPWDSDDPLYDQTALNTAVAAEREACAKVCDVKEGTEPIDILGGEEGIDLCLALGAAIRSRSNKTEES
jgi:hypothetical protein